ncbi:hypothetical protein [Corallococcus llansteffanensis]|uniref:Uncharacterized protein n=1 Tax=Corallococcus llansteffanensis TaxID=2316731 RepID=A0A3A8NCZ4_9BACT|nr:hypothetical protein [Corallococcus llansteffanensis]RKH41449.1 hypothetical protein D7V93_38720 [Corallococcus llansteffanensis]
MWRSLLCGMALGLGCSASRPLPGVVQPDPGERLASIPGPLPGHGPYKSFSDALIAACPLILQQPQATAGRPTDQEFPLRWRLSQEYCAWVYYTPDHQFELSMLATSAVQDDSRKRSCALPPVVTDPRHPPESLGYVFILHNHPFENELSDFDIRFAVAMADVHGLTVSTRAGLVPLSIIAFFSRGHDVMQPTCDGFFQYVPSTGQIIRWTAREQGRWQSKQIATLTWLDDTNYRIQRQ